jgi:1-acyl-sn-glycerol-3-phosphate acyltransferase
VILVRALRSAWIWVASASLVLMWVPLMGLIRFFDRDPLHRRTAWWFRCLGRIISRVHPWRLHISGRENIDPARCYVVVSNHQSLADIPLIAHLDIDAKWLAKVELFRTVPFGWMLRMAGDIPVDRADRRKGAQALLQAARRLREGCSIVFFPEGTRSLDGQVQPFSEGPFQLAIREQKPVLPLVVEGSGAALPSGTVLFSATQDIILKVLPPVEVAAWNPKQGVELRDTVRQLIIDELQRLRRTC